MSGEEKLGPPRRAAAEELRAEVERLTAENRRLVDERDAEGVLNGRLRIYIQTIDSACRKSRDHEGEHES